MIVIRGEAGKVKNRKILTIAHIAAEGSRLLLQFDDKSRPLMGIRSLLTTGAILPF
jgi:hypothetical protein